MQKKTVYLAGKITGDPFYRSKFYEAQKKLEEGGFIVVNPALLPSEGFTWEAYMRMAGAMLNECAEVCFLPDWTESRGAKYEFGEAVAQKKPFFFFNDWEAKQNAEKITRLPFLFLRKRTNKSRFSSGRRFNRGAFRNWRFCITFRTAGAETRSRRHAFGRRA